MKNKFVITILSVGLILTATACGTASSDSEDDTSLATEIVESNTTDGIADTEDPESTEISSNTESSGSESEQSDTTEASGDTEQSDSTEDSDSTEAAEGTDDTESGSIETSGDNEATDGTETTSEEIPDISDITLESKDDGITLLKALFGTEDFETGNQYVFIYLNTVTIDDVEYYAYTWSWAVDDHYSRLTDVFVSTDGSAVYEGDYDADNCVFNTENMLTE